MPTEPLAEDDMKFRSSNRWLNYTETRCDEALQVAANNDYVRLLDLACHHLRCAEGELSRIHPDDKLADTARRVIDRRILPALLTMTILAGGEFDKDFDADRKRREARGEA